MSQSDTVAIAAHLHVLLRRKTGRVTDTEWMAVNPEYAWEVVRFAKESARTDGHEDLLVWANRLEAQIPGMSQPPRLPLVDRAAQALRRASETKSEEPHPASGTPTGMARYVRGIR
jgi:hypothetical protein